MPKVDGLCVMIGEKMIYTGYELLWLFFVYSFLGWIFETATAALKKKRFINRGLVNGDIWMSRSSLVWGRSVSSGDLP